MAGLTITLFVATMNQTVVATAAQNIVADIGGFDRFVWLFAGFSLAATAAVPVVGKLSDIAGRKLVLIGSVIFFMVTSAAAGVSMNMTQLIVARVLQGAAFAGVMGSVWIIMAALWAPSERAKWMGVATVGFTLSGVMGPIFGGIVSDTLTWRWVFFINIPSGFVSLVVLWIWFPNVAPGKREGRLDLMGAAFFAGASTALLLALTWGGRDYAWDSPRILSLIVGSLAAFAVFARVELRVDDPMLPLNLFSHRVFALGWLASLTTTSTFIAITAFQPLFVQGVLGKSATSAAIPLVALAIGVAVGANVSGQILSRRGYPRMLGMTGLSISTAALLMMSALGSSSSLWALFATTGFLGFGMSFGFTAFTVPVQNAMPISILGVVTSTLQFGRMFGQAAGSAVFGAVLFASVAVSIVGLNEDSPQIRITDPEMIVAVDRLAEIRNDYSLDPELGEERFRADLATSRDNLAKGLANVFRLAAAFSLFGVVLAWFTFPHGVSGTASGGNRRKNAPAADTADRMFS
ncbi:MAG TPA: MFS transporter [Dehalococcoidia bacterium]|mgnify:CR=1 FL=1|nr:MFS transporter [Dehalococcoidia bacterium]MDP7161293.1 MFS transporter [Dehalococcoidia bacterium]MDP7515139.1 MFS transporter [Dehalococcoidia bacterium]HJM54464.1 MFS transporter [Dehalococcoidia bacterium]